MVSVPDPPLIELRQTPKGRGVFALMDLTAGSPVVVGRPLAESPERTNYSLQVAFDRHVDLDEPGRLINHSCEPSTFPVHNEHGGYTFVARRDIAADEEITFDYDTTEFFSIAVEQCLCGARTCRGRTRGFLHMPDDVKRTYGPQVAGYAQGWKPLAPKDDGGMNTQKGHTAWPPFAITAETESLYLFWHAASQRFPAECDVLSVASSCALFSLWPMAPKARRIRCTTLTLDTRPQHPLRQTPKTQANDKATAPGDWSAHILLAALTARENDPNPAALHARKQHMDNILELDSLNLATLRGPASGGFDVLNVPDASLLPGDDVSAWSKSLARLLSLLQPGGHLVLTLPPANRARGADAPPLLRELTAGTCLEALQSSTLGLQLVSHTRINTAEATSFVLLSRDLVRGEG